MGLKKAFICLVVCMMAFPIGSGVSLAAVETRITHKPEGYYLPGFRIKITAQVEDATPIKEVRCYFKTKEMEDYLFVNMTATAEGPNNYEGVLPAPGLGSENLEYYILFRNGADGVAKSDSFQMKEKETPEASEWNASQGKNLSEEGRTRVQEELEGRIRERYRNDLVKWLQPKGGDSFSVNAENPVTNLRRFSFSDRMSTKVVDAGQRLSHLAVRPVGSASAGGGGSTSGTTIMGMSGTTVAVAGGAVVAAGVLVGSSKSSGGGSSGGSSGGNCASPVGTWNGSSGCSGGSQNTISYSFASDNTYTASAISTAPNDPTSSTTCSVSGTWSLSGSSLSSTCLSATTTNCTGSGCGLPSCTCSGTSSMQYSCPTISNSATDSFGNTCSVTVTKQ